MHRLLKRQFKRIADSKLLVESEFFDFASLVEQAYHSFDEERAILEQSLTLSSNELLNRNKELNLLLSALPDTIIWFDNNLIVKYVRHTDELKCLFANIDVYKSLKDIEPLSSNEGFNSALALTLESGMFSQCILEIALDKDDAQSFYFIEVRLQPLLNKRGHLLLIRDISQQKKLENKLQLLATTDPLTGAKNRAYFFETANKEIERCLRRKRQLTVAMIDIDFFKGVNDFYGHAAGDEVLVQTTNLIMSHIRTEDLFCRYGGEEFVLLFSETGLTQTLDNCNRLRESLAALNVNVHEQNINITVSMGVCQMDGDFNTIESMLNQADKKLYEAKGRGRNRVCY